MHASYLLPVPLSHTAVSPYVIRLHRLTSLRSGDMWTGAGESRASACLGMLRPPCRRKHTSLRVPARPGPGLTNLMMQEKYGFELPTRWSQAAGVCAFAVMRSLCFIPAPDEHDGLTFINRDKYSLCLFAPFERRRMGKGWQTERLAVTRAARPSVPAARGPPAHVRGSWCRRTSWASGSIICSWYSSCSKANLC